jgi:hypothetical protein
MKNDLWDLERFRRFFQSIEEAVARRDRLGLADAYVDFGNSTIRLVGARPVIPGVEVGHVPRLEGFPKAIYSAVLVTRGSPLREVDRGYDLGQMEHHAEGIAAASSLMTFFEEGGLRLQHYVAPLGRQCEPFVRLTWKDCQPFLSGDDGLRKAAEPMGAWIVEPVEQARDTRQMLERAREDIKRQVEKAAEERGRQKGRNEILSKLDERLRSLLMSEEK